MSKDEVGLKRLYNKDGDFDHESIKDVARRIGSGEFEIARLSPEEERGRIAGGRRNVEASLICGAETRANQAESRGGRPTRKEKFKLNARIESELEKYAKSEGLWFEYDKFRNAHAHLVNGQEAHVFEDSQNKAFVLKAVDYDFGNYGISPLDFLDNKVSLFNYLFPSAKYELVGFTRDNDGRFRFILRQPFITGKTLHPGKRERYMKRVLGMKSEALTPEQYINPNYHIWDLHLKNLIEDDNGNVFVIDALLELNTPDRYLNGVRAYKPFDINKKS